MTPELFFAIYGMQLNMCAKVQSDALRMLVSARAEYFNGYADMWERTAAAHVEFLRALYAPEPRYEAGKDGVIHPERFIQRAR